MKNYITIKNKKFPATFAITPDEQEIGLMWKKWPPPIMCFLFDNYDIRKFWMKNTISPLDIVFCKDNKIIDICYGEPLSEKHVGPDLECNLVIELPFGYAKKLKLSNGDEVKIHHTLKSIAQIINK